MTAEEHIFVQFQGTDGSLCGNPLSIPVDSTTEQLDSIINGLLVNEEPLPYSFTVQDHDLIHSLSEVFNMPSADGGKVSKKGPTREGIVTIIYQPQAIFRVQAVSRCTSTLAGHEDAILCMSFSPDGAKLATGSGDKTVRFWDLMTETPFRLKANNAHEGWVLCLAWSPDGRILASGGMDGYICLWDGQSGSLLGRLTGHRKWITQLAWEPLHLSVSGSRLASSSKDGTVKIWDTTRRACTVTLSQHTDAVTSVKWAGDGTIYTGSRDRTIKMWESDGRLKGQLTGHAHWINTLALSTDHVLRTGAFGYQHAEGQDLREVARERFETTVKTMNGERLVSGSDDFTLSLWDPSKTNKPLARLTGHQAAVNHVVFSPDGRWLASASFDKSIKLWNARTGAFVATLRGHVGRVYQVAWSADSRLLLSSSQDSTLKVWDVRTRTRKEDLPGHYDEVYAVDWSADGARAASGGKDKLLKIWRQ